MSGVVLRTIAVILVAWLLAMFLITLPLTLIGLKGAGLSLASFLGGLAFGIAAFMRFGDWISA